MAHWFPNPIACCPGSLLWVDLLGPEANGGDDRLAKVPVLGAGESHDHGEGVLIDNGGYMHCDEIFRFNLFQLYDRLTPAFAAIEKIAIRGLWGLSLVAVCRRAD